MVSVLRFLVALFLCAHVSLLAFAEEDAVLPAASTILDRVKAANELCLQQTPSFTTEVRIIEHKKAIGKKVKKVRGKKKVEQQWRITREKKEVITQRPVVLCAFDEQDSSWHIIEIRVPYPQRSEFAFTLQTPGYRLERVGGTGVARLTFNAYRTTDRGEQKLIVYRYLHSWFSPLSLAKGNGPHLLDDVRFVSYTPSSPALLNDATLPLGMRYLYGELMEVYKELRESGEHSKTFPKELLADVIDWRIPYALAANEQMDHDKFTADAWGTTANVFNEFALNGPETFMWSFSNFEYKGRIEHAAGVMQFTNHMGTYDSVRRDCPRAHIDPQFLRGAQDLRNALKAAICLLDVELSRLPVGAHMLYRSNPPVGGVYPVIAYNAGGGRAKSAYNAITANGIDLETTDLDLPEQVFVRQGRTRLSGKKKGQSVLLRVLPSETEMYIKKYMYVLEFIEQFQSELVPIAPPSPKKDNGTALSHNLAK